MRLIELGECRALSALALEEAILESVDAGAGRACWVTWTTPQPVAVLGTARPAEGDLLRPALEADGVQVLRRRSGGGTVVLGPASPAITLVDRAGGDIGECYQRFCATLIAALGRLGVAAEFRSPADLAVAERKIAGLAQRRKKNAALVTASLLAGSMSAEAGKYLVVPGGRDAPEYRLGRDHAGFMTSLGELSVEREAWRGALGAELAALGAVRGAASPAEEDRAAGIELELARPGWIYRL